MLCFITNCPTSGEKHEFNSATCKFKCTGYIKQKEDSDDELSGFDLLDDAEIEFKDFSMKPSLPIKEDIDLYEYDWCDIASDRERQTVEKKTCSLKEDDDDDDVTSMEAELERLDIEEADAMPVAESCLRLRRFLCTPVSLIINEKGTLDLRNTMRINEKNITKSDWPLLHALELLSSSAIALVSQTTWSELKSLSPLDIFLSPEDRSNQIYKSFIYKYSGFKARSPTIIEPTEPLQETKSFKKSKIIQTKGFICPPVTLIINEKGALDAAKTMKYNADLSPTDTPLLQALEYANILILSLISQMSWMKLKSLNPIEQNISPRQRFSIIWSIFVYKSTGFELRDPEDVRVYVGRKKTLS